MRILALLVLALPISANCVSAQSVAQVCDETRAAPCTAPSAPGRIVYLDPETNEILTGEEAARARAAEDRSDFVEALSDQARQSFSVEGLVEQRTETGAIALDLEGRFQSPLVATIGNDGTVQVEHFQLPAHD